MHTSSAMQNNKWRSARKAWRDKVTLSLSVAIPAEEFVLLPTVKHSQP